MRAPSPTAMATLPAASAASPQAKTPGTLVSRMPSVLMNGPLGPSSNSQPSNAASGLAMRVRGWVNNPASVIVRRSAANWRLAAWH